MTWVAIKHLTCHSTGLLRLLHEPSSQKDTHDASCANPPHMNRCRREELENERKMGLGPCSAPLECAKVSQHQQPRNDSKVVLPNKRGPHTREETERRGRAVLCLCYRAVIPPDWLFADFHYLTTVSNASGRAWCTHMNGRVNAQSHVTHM